MRIITRLLAGLLICWGLLALTVRIATPFIADQRDQAAAALSDRLGTPVVIGRLGARWYGPSPLLELHDVAIGTAPEVLRIQRVGIDLDLPALLRGGFADALRVTVDGMQVTAVREPSGQFHLEGIGLITRDDDAGTSPPPLPSHLRMVNTRVLWIDRMAGKDAFTLDNVNVLLDRDANRLKLRARLETTQGTAEVSARLDGFLGTTEWHGDTYIKVDGLDVADLFAPYLPQSYGIDGLQLDVEAWMRWEAALPVESQGEIHLRNLALHPKSDDAQPLDLSAASTRYAYRRDASGLQLGLRQLSLDFGDHRWPDTDVAVTIAPQADDTRRIEVAASYLRIDDIVRILQVRLPWESLREPLAKLRPTGELHDLRLSALSGGEAPGWRATARFTGISTTPWNTAPGLENISGSLHGQQDHIVLELDSTNAAVRFNELFRDPLQLPSLQGRLDVTRQPGGWQVDGERLLADTPHIKTLTRVHLRHDDEHPLFLDLQADFRDGDAAFANHYYPVAIMDKHLVDWLDQSIVAGRVIAGTTLVHGPLSDFPFEQSSNGVFQVVFDTQDIELDYREGWPKIENLAAHVRFHGNQLDIESKSGTIYDSRIVEVAGHIGSLNPTGPLQIDGRLQGPLRNNLRALDEPALHERFGHFAQILSGEGDTSLTLGFTVPLAGHGEYALAGRLQFDNNRLSLPDWDVRVSDIRGALDFTLDGLTAEGIEARALGAPVVVDVLPLPDGLTRVRTRGRLEVDNIANQLPTLPLAFASGEADFTINVDVPSRRAAPDNPALLSIESQLQGIALALPQPLGKSAPDTRPLALRLPLDRATVPASLSYGDQVSAKFSPDGARVDLVLGGHAATLGDTDGIRITGRLESVDVIAWGDALAHLPTGGATPPAVVDLDLQIDRLQIDTLGLKAVRIQAGHRAPRWRGRIDSPDLVGTFSLPDAADGEPIAVDLQRLALQLPIGSDDEPPGVPDDPAAGPDPTTLPGISLQVAELQINQAQLGEMHLDAQHSPEGLRVTRLSLGGGQVELDSAGHWVRESGKIRSRLGGRLSAANLGDLLVALGYSRQAEDAGGSLEFLLQWPGHPLQAEASTMEGKLTLDVGAGRLVELDPGVTRVVGLLNLNALTRRLRLDFSDIYKKGYSFDSIKGDFDFATGRANTDNLTVLGPTGRIELRGSSDLRARTLDQRVTVTPNLDATLPIAGTLAGGPVAGIAVLVAQKVMTKQLDRLNRFEYSLSGSWYDPEIEQLDSGGTLSKILRPLDGGTEHHTGPAAQADAPPSDAAKASTTSDITPGGSAAPNDTAAQAAVEKPAGPPAEKAGDTGNPLRGLIDFLKKGETQDSGVPNAPN